MPTPSKVQRASGSFQPRRSYDRGIRERIPLLAGLALIAISFAVRSARAREITNVAGRSSELLGEGIPLAAQPPEYVYTRLPELRPQLLAAATKDAQNRGRVIVEATGAHLGKLRGVDVGVFQVTTPNSTQVEDYGVYDTGTLEKDVTAVVNVTFALK